jgi:hypothetical protein
MPHFPTYWSGEKIEKEAPENMQKLSQKKGKSNSPMPGKRVDNN